MFLALWYYLCGYVKIRVKGFSAERFMNMAAYRGVYLWEVAREGAGMTMKAAGNSLELLQACAEKTGCALEVLSYGGLPVFLGRFGRRQVWTAGLFCFAAGLYLLSSFVWVMRIEGNERLSKEELLSACREMGLYPGVRKRSVDTQAVTNGLLEDFADISWVSVGIHGTDATIRLAETIEGVEIIDKETPCDIVASTDGVILQITAERGTPLVAAGDVVKKGDVLISSALTIGLEGEEQHTEYTAAEGTVTARIWRRLTEEVLLQYEEAVYSGEEKENHSLLFSGRELDILHPDSDVQWERELLSEKTLGLGDRKLPLTWRRERWRAYETVQKTRTAAEAKTLLEEKLRKNAENLLSPYGTIEDIQIRYEVYANSVRADAEITMAERIEEKKQNIETENQNEEKEQENANEL